MVPWQEVIDTRGENFGSVGCDFVNSRCRNAGLCVCVCVCVCVWKVFLIRKVAGNLSLHHESVRFLFFLFFFCLFFIFIYFIYLFLLGGLAYVWYSTLNHVMPSLSLWGYHSSSYIFDCSAISSSRFSFCWSSGEFPVWSSHKHEFRLL